MSLYSPPIIKGKNNHPVVIVHMLSYMCATLGLLQEGLLSPAHPLHFYTVSVRK